MRVGVFGDSFAAQHHLGIGSPWPAMLNDQFNLDVTSYGVNGSSLEYSYRKFDEMHSQYDKIVFVITGPGRLTLPLPEEYKDACLGQLRHITGVASFKATVERLFSDVRYLKNTALALEGYYNYILDFDKDKLFHRLLIKEIKSIRPDALLIPCLYLTGEENWHQRNTLNCISDIDVNNYGLVQEKAMWADKRHCHMSQENNLIFASMVAEWINTGSFNFDITKFVKSDKPVETYFQMDVYNSK